MQRFGTNGIRRRSDLPSDVKRGDGFFPVAIHLLRLLKKNTVEDACDVDVNCLNGICSEMAIIRIWIED